MEDRRNSPSEGGSHGVAKVELSKAGDVASQREAGDGIQHFGEGVPELL